MTHPNFPKENDAEDLMNYMWDFASDYYMFKDKPNGFSEDETKKLMLNTIKEIKSEWCKKQREICAEKVQIKHDLHIDKDSILNAPKPH